MAVTQLPSALTIQHWSAKDLVEARAEMWLQNLGLIGEGPEFPIQVFTELTKDAGDTINVPLRLKLTGSGVRGDADIEGQEEALVYRNDSFTVDYLRNGVLTPGRMSEKRSRIDIRKDGASALKDWWGEIFEQTILNHMVGNTDETFPATALAPSNERDLYGGAGNTAESQIVNNITDRLMLYDISLLKQRAQAATPRVRPFKINGRPWYVLVVHPNVLFHLKHNEGTGKLTDQWRLAQENAQMRGDEHPLFSGAAGIWDGVVIVEHELMPLFTNASSVTVARSVLLGAQALALGFGSAPTWDEVLRNGNSQLGIYYGAIWGVKKLRYTVPDGANQDFGLYTFSSNATTPGVVDHS